VNEPGHLPVREPAVADRGDAAPLDPAALDPMQDVPVTGYAVGAAARSRQTSRGTLRHLRAIRLILNGMLLLALMYTITLTKSLLIPLVLAAFLGLALNPIVAAGSRRGLPRWLCASVLMMALIGSLGFGVSKVAQPAMGWIEGAPATMKQLLPKFRSITAPFEMANRATQNLVNGPPSRAHPAAEPTIAIGPWDLLAKAPAVLAAMLTVTLLVFFFLVFGDTLLRRLVEIVPDFHAKRHAVAIVRSIQTEVSRYILTTSLINLTLGLFTAAMLWWLKMPDPLLWGTVAMLANYIPYVGAITTTTILTIVGLVHFDQLGQAMLPALCFIVFTIVEGNLITPMVLGRRMRVSPIAILLWLLIWGWLWGIPGALLAVPMLTSVKLIAERIRGWGWFAVMVQR
jgi:predicted PurR-regulated permease PerM